MKNVKLIVNVIAPDKNHALVVARTMAATMIDVQTNFIKKVNCFYVHGPLLQFKENQDELKQYRITFDIDSDFRKA